MEPLMDRPPDLRSLLHSLWRRKWLFLGILISIPAAVYVISTLVTKTYEASTLVRLEAVRTDITSLSTPTIASVDTEALLLPTGKVAEQAARELGGSQSPDEISAAVRTEPLTTGSGQSTDLLYVTAQATEAVLAAETANAYANGIDEVRTGKALREIDESIAALEAQSREASNETAEAEFERQLQLLRGARTGAQDSTQVIQAASAPGSPISPQPKRNTALAGLVALLLALGAVALAERLDRRLRDSTELEPLLGASLLSVIPRAAFPGERPAPGPVREAFRTLAASLVYFNIEQPISTVIVASPTKGDGKTTVAVHLAAALAKDGKRTILVDCDLRHPQVAVRLGIEPAAGIVEVITQHADLTDALVDVDVGDGRLQVLAAGAPPPNPARLLGSKRMVSLLDELSTLADIVIVDTPPILNVSDAVPLLERVSGTVVVAKVGTTTEDAIRRVRQVVETARGNILGAVATGSAGSGLYGYGAEYYGDDSTADIEPLLPDPPIQPPDDNPPAKSGSDTTEDIPESDLDADVGGETEPQPGFESEPELEPHSKAEEPTQRVEPWGPNPPASESTEEDSVDTGRWRSRVGGVPPIPSQPSPPGNGQQGVEQGSVDPVEPPEMERARVGNEPTQEWDVPAEWDEYEGWREREPWADEPDEWETNDE
jgi:capsular exopolysaccharide synthesis family protein